MSQAQQQIKLPPINQSSTQTGPFKLPSDNQLLLEKQRTSKERDKKIWDKATASCRSALKRFDQKKFKTAIDDKYVPINNYNSKQKKLIENALQIIQMRKKNKDLATKNETIVDILEQKKQMFLVTMTHEIIEQEINNLKTQANEREKGLKQSNQILQQDIDDFEQYQDKYKMETKKIQEQFQKQVQKRLGLQQQIKNKQITLNSLKAQKSRNQQSISIYLKYKEFLDQLDKDWLEKRQKKKSVQLNQVKEKLKAQYIKEQQQSQRRTQKLQEQFAVFFNSIRESGENSQIEKIVYDEEMCFHEPHQLIKHFNDKQEENLFCIQHYQYAEQKFQQLKVKSQTNKSQLSQRYQGHVNQKKQLQKQFMELENQIKMLKKKKDQNNMIDQKNSKDIKSMIASEYQNMKETMHFYLPELENNAQSLSLLSGIQICMEKLWSKIVQLYQENPKAIRQIKNNHEKKKVQQKREQAARTNKIQEQKRKIRNLEKKAPAMRIVGRIDMKRSPPEEKIVQKKVQTEGKDMDDDRKYLMD